MRKIFLFAAVVAVALSSCSKNEITVNPASDANAIGFSNYVGTSTKAGVTDKDVINTDGESMGVFAEYVADDSDATGVSNFMNNTKVTRGASDWTYSPLKYWPTSGTIDFCAYYPYDGTNAGTSSAFPSVKFTQVDALDGMVDFVYATAYDQTKTTVATTDNEVKFVFKHALSRIAFSARPADGLADATAANSTFITVTGVKVTPVANQVVKIGTLTYNKNIASTPYATIAAETPATAANTHAAAAWTISDTDVNLYSGDISATTVQPVENTQLTTADDYIFIVPQTFADATEYMAVEVEYTITTYDSTLATDNKIVVMAGNTKTVQMPAMTFAQGQAYNFPLVISLDAIVFGDVTVDQWGDELPQNAL